MKPMVIFALSAVLAGCAYQQAAELLPTNQLAATYGTLHARFIAHGTGHGEAELISSSGATLKGLYQLNRRPMYGFGDVIVAALTKQGTAAMLEALGNYQRVSEGKASVSGIRNETAICQFYNDNITGHGFGACKLSNGALYSLKY